jgi:thiamine biosynthesis lipoprotein
MRIIGVLLTIIALSACSDRKPKAIYNQGHAFGTTYFIQYYSSEDQNLKPGVDSVIAAINQSVSTYIPDSDISRINRGDTTVVVDEYFKEAYLISARLHEETEGYFDPTVGVLRNAYGFGEVKPMERIDSLVLDSLMKYVGFNKVRITEDNRVYKEFPQIYFDFNAVAKGSGLDHIGDYLESKGITDYLIELGGEILAKGENIAKGKPWVVGIETPDSDLDNRSYEATVQLKNEGLAASGNYRKFRVDSITGIKYVHTINPLTGSAEKSDVTSATVIAPTCGEADAYATSFMAMGFERSVALLNNLRDIEAYLTYTDENGEDKVYITTGFKERMAD